MKTILAAAALSLSFTAVTAQAQQTLYNPTAVYAQAGQWYNAPNGCSYSRTQAPGQGVVWMLIANPHHIGGRNARASCPSMLRG